MSSSSSASKCGVFARRYSMMDKTSGQEIGVLFIPEGQAVPDLGQVELKICKAKAGDDEQILIAEVEDSGAANPLDVNGNKEKSVSLSSLPDDPISMYKKPGQSGWIRKVTLSSTDHRVTSVTYIRDVGVGEKKHRFTRREGLRRFLKERQNHVLTIQHFCWEKKVLGLENMEVIEEEHTVDFSKPCKFGWLRIVTIRSTDMRVTCLRYLTPPDASGRRLSKNYKKDIEKYLHETGNKNLDVEDFTTIRKVLGLSSEFEIINYSDQPNLTSDNVDCTIDERDSCLTSEDQKKKGLGSVTTEEDCKSVRWLNVSQISSLETLIDDSFSSSEDVIDNDSNSSYTDDDSDAIEPVIGPHSDIPRLSVSPDLSMDTTPASDADYNILPGETAASATPPCSRLKETDSCLPIFGKYTTVSPSPSADESFSHSLPALPARSTLAAANPTPSSSPPSHRVSAPTPMATLLMVSEGHGSGRRQQKMMIKSGVKVMKGMKMFGIKFGLDLRKLRFSSDGNELTGEELAGELEGAKIVVEELG